MITEDYVSFETAKLLKEKGFDADIDLWYDENGEMFFKYKYDISSDYRVRQNQNVYLCPTLQMAMKWLREKYEYVALFDVSAWGSYDWYYIYRGNRYHYEEMTFNYNGLEDAAEAAIKYCLDNLI